jgi:ubiquinone/menaquinone biosynthesis C-methylase UbiE
MAQVRSNDSWNLGESYEPYVGRWSRRVAEVFIDWLAVREQSDWLDVGCGTGALSETVLRLANPRTVKAVDSSAGFIQYAKSRVAGPRVTFEVGDARALPVDSESVDAAVAGLVLNFVPEPLSAVAEMTRATRRGGTVAAYVWDYAQKMELMRYFWDAAVALDPAARELDEGRRFPLCHPEFLAQLFEDAGLQDVDVRSVDIPTDFIDFAAYWSPFLGGQGPAPGYAMSLDEERRSALRERLRAKLPAAEDGSIHLIARAWAVRGRKG